MTKRRWALIAVAIAGLVWAIGGEYVSITHGVTENHFLDALVGLSFLTTGVIALDRQPGNVIGPLMVGFAVTWFFGNWSNVLLPAMGFVGGALGTPFIGHIALAYPNGALRTGAERVVLRLAYGVAIGTSVVFALTWNPHVTGCAPCPDTLAALPSRGVATAAEWVSDRSGIVLVPIFLALVAVRWRRASPRERRDLAPLWIAISMLAIVYMVGSFASPDTSQPFPYLLWEIRGVLQIFVPIVFVWGLLSTRLARSAVSDLVVELERPLPPGGLGIAMKRALGDPTLEVAYAIEGSDRWVDADGSSIEVPSSDQAGRAVTIVERQGRPIAALVHDPALDEGLVRSAGAAAGMAIDNERLRAEVRAQLEEVRASRQRIIEAGDRERRRVERNLHDGAQQRLVTLSLAIAMLRERAGSDPAVAEDLEQISTELKGAIDELRELARGIHPAILTDEGLGAAVESLAARSSGRVTVQLGIEGRLPDPVEATAYFVVAESLANVAKYAQASSAFVNIGRENGYLRIRVADDGIGTADPSRGSGLRGLEDRVSAVGGTFLVDSRPGMGTRIQAEIPLETAPPTAEDVTKTPIERIPSER
ncbi:MAG: sensor histidine kinase [Actinomycetota bacterium]